MNNFFKEHGLEAGKLYGFRVVEIGHKLLGEEPGYEVWSAEEIYKMYTEDGLDMEDIDCLIVVEHFNDLSESSRGEILKDIERNGFESEYLLEEETGELYVKKN